ncbi:MAG: hypothetical protein ABW321_06520, partial [Polyangiales bacterium]
GFKSWLCETSDAFDAVPHTRSLHGALAEQHQLRVEQIQFDHPSFARAHLELRDLASEAHQPSGWHVHMQYVDAAWQVTRADDHDFRVHDKVTKTP